ncbi:MAG: pyridoxine 5'-phosphate synthase [Planctomycetota bacterium]
MIKLGVNIDHVATIRQARRGTEPDPIAAAVIAELAGADGITVHVRQDRRHIQDRDLRLLKQTVRGTLNLELAPREEGGVLELALEVLPDQICLVPENRQEVTTEGGLSVKLNDLQLRRTVERLVVKGCVVSIFVEPDPVTISAAASIGAQAVELHTGSWANAWAACKGDASNARLKRERTRLHDAAKEATARGLRLHAGHGINYANVSDLLDLPGLREMNIGHSIVSRAVLVGMDRAVREMKEIISR